MPLPSSLVSTDLHVVLGSGLALELSTFVVPSNWSEWGRVSMESLNLQAPSAPGHQGEIRIFESKTGRKLSLQLGRHHGYEGLTPKQVVELLLKIRSIGTERFLLTNAAGGLQKHLTVGSVVLLSDHVNLTGQNPLVGKNTVGPRFPDMTHAYDPTLRKSFLPLLKNNGLKVSEGVYLGLLGPSYETAAEIKLFSSWGLDVVGMSTVWEAIALRQRGAKVMGLSLVSNLGTGLSSDILTEEDVLQAGKKSSKQILKSIFEFTDCLVDEQIA